MYTEEQQKLFRNIALIAGLVLTFIIISFAWYIMTRVGHVEVNAIVVPSDSKVSYDHGLISNGTNYLRPGKHTVTISRDNFKTSSYDIVVKPDTSEISISTSPSNKEGERYLADNPEENQRYEVVGYSMRKQASDEMIEKYPQVPNLPHRHFSRTSVYTVSYGGADINNTPILVVTNSSTQGRKDALQWIKDNNFDINSIIINYDDYDSPLAKRSQP